MTDDQRAIHEGHGHGHGHDHGQEHGYADGHGSSRKGWRGSWKAAWGALTHPLRPHSHDSADSVDDELEASAEGVRALKISLVLLAVTAAFQLVIVMVSGSVALLADTVHNFSDTLIAVPLWVAFVVGRRAATPRYTYGYGRAEDLAGVFIVAMIALSAVVAGVESVRRLIDPQPVSYLGWVIAAGLIGFVGNELVAVYRIRVGRRIGSAALVADGVHARADGFTSLAVVAGAWSSRALRPRCGAVSWTGSIPTSCWQPRRRSGARRECSPSSGCGCGGSGTGSSPTPTCGCRPSSQSGRGTTWPTRHGPLCCGRSPGSSTPRCTSARPDHTTSLLAERCGGD